MQSEYQNLFPASSSVSSQRILYTPSAWAKANLLYLQEVGRLTAIKPHTNTRENLRSFLCFAVTSGTGELYYEGRHLPLAVGDCVFIDCSRPYAHSTSEDLWTLQWCHFYGAMLPAVYEKYKERGGQPVFRPSDTSFAALGELMSEIQQLAASTDYIRDMHINEKLNALLSIMMEYSWHPEHLSLSRKRLELHQVKGYLDDHYTEHITLEELSSLFFIDKHYLTKIFKEAYGVTIIAYVEQRRITQAKSLLRFTDQTVEEIGAAVGMPDANYFSRRFRRIEGMSPREYRKMW